MTKTGNLWANNDGLLIVYPGPRKNYEAYLKDKEVYTLRSKILLNASGLSTQLDWYRYNLFIVTVSSSTTFSIDSARPDSDFVIVLKKDATGSSYNLTWPSSVTWLITPILSLTTANQEVVLSISYYDGVFRAGYFTGQVTALTAPGSAPSGGSTGQVLTKNSATNYDYSWISPSGSYLTISNNLSDLANAVTARTNLGLDTGVNITSGDWNNATKSGLYFGSAVSNAPLGSAEWFMGEVDVHTTDWVTQTVYAFTTSSLSDSKMYRRQKQAGVWGAWGRVRVYESEMSSSATPTGAVSAYAGSTAPSGWLLCYGQAVSRTTYAALFTAISTTFGVGDGSTTFNLPDLRGRAPVGKDDMGGSAASRMTVGGSGINGAVLGANGGAQTHTLVTGEIPAHTHTVQLIDIVGGAGTTGPAQASDNNLVGTHTSSSTGGGGAHNNTQPSLILNYIIKT